MKSIRNVLPKTHSFTLYPPKVLPGYKAQWIFEYLKESKHFLNYFYYVCNGIVFVF